MFHPSVHSWRDQYERVLRSRSRVQKEFRSSVEYNDALQHFFQDCWHLKDWIKNDKTTGVSLVIESEVDSHKPLRVVADLANGAKHLDRHTHREGAHVTSTDVTVHLGQDKPIDVHYVVSLGDGTTMSAQDLVDQAFEAWVRVLRNLRLQP
jgi:hypothetical protein